MSSATPPSGNLMDVLERARRLGVLGPGPVDEHVTHARGFVIALADVPDGATVVDLGSGGGVPGLVIGAERPGLRLVLLDSLERRVALLAEAIVTLGWSDRAEALLARAEDVGRQERWRGAVDAVTARSFGPPATVAECASPLLRVGGRLIVSEPPGNPDRWPTEGLARFGLTDSNTEIPGMRILDQTVPCPEEFPRRVGMPAKRPLF